MGRSHLFRVMGTTAHVLVHGGPASLPGRAAERLRDLEARWTRFRADSELSRLATAGGGRASPETFALLSAARDAWRLTGGAFDCTVHDAVVAAGYDRDFAVVARLPGVTGPTRPSPGCGGIELDPATRMVRLPRGVRIDVGGIGKGFAADLVARELRDGGADGVMVDLGGDVRVLGQPGGGGPWQVAVAPPGDELDEPLLLLDEGAVATSSTLRRRWLTAGGEQRHHLIDPRTGRSLDSPLVQATVLAEDGWWAEALTKAALLEPDVMAALALLDAHGVAGVAFDVGGRRHDSHLLPQFLS